MFRPMRRSAQALAETEAWEVLGRGSYGVLAVAGDGGYPYAVPLNYACVNDKIYIHCAREGHKLDAIGREARVSFCVVDQDRVVPQEYTTHYRSVVAFGRARILSEDGELREALAAIVHRYCPGMEEAAAGEIEKSMGRVAVIEVSVEKLSGKEALPLVHQR